MDTINKRVVENSITIHAPINRVWDTLTNPEETKKYMFGCEAVSDWKPGSPLLWRATHDGQQTVYVKGTVLAIEPPTLLTYTVIDPHANMPDVPDNYLNVYYQLSEMDGITTLTVSQDGFEKAADGEKRYHDVYNNGEGWNPVLVQIKKVAEEG
ncbi:MAG TPA: SRPBCC domain-containing protein [Chitinophagaceae bacterium]|nr:SRPBCC domain-containing protein [Chitinophagaceae bacterium]